MTGRLIPLPISCAHCGAVTLAANGTRRFCSGRCKVAARRLRVRGPSTRHSWTSEALRDLKENYATVGAATISAKYGFKVTEVYQKARKQGITSRGHGIRAGIAEDYFHTIDTPMRAYLLGFLLADGSVNNHGQIIVTLNRKDTTLLDLIRNELTPGRTIYAQRQAHSLSFRCPTMAADLAQWGMVPRKTYSLSWPETLPCEIYRPFILGYFDGDGSLSWSRRPDIAHLRWSIFGRSAFLLPIADILHAETGANVLRYLRREEWAEIAANGSHAAAIDRWLHQDGIGIERKRLGSVLSSPHYHRGK